MGEKPCKFFCQPNLRRLNKLSVNIKMKITVKLRSDCIENLWMAVTGIANRNPGDEINISLAIPAIKVNSFCLYYFNIHWIK